MSPRNWNNIDLIRMAFSSRAVRLSINVARVFDTMFSITPGSIKTLTPSVSLYVAM